PSTSLFFLKLSPPHRDLHSFPTRRSSDLIREEMVMSLTSYIGTERNILAETPQHCHTLKLEHPILTNRDLEKLRRVSQGDFLATDRKSTRLNSSHLGISYAVFCLKKKKKQ